MGACLLRLQSPQEEVQQAMVIRHQAWGEMGIPSTGARAATEHVSPPSAPHSWLPAPPVSVAGLFCEQ